MTLELTGSEILVNAGLLGGDQGGVRTVGLSNGGWVTVWLNPNPSSITFQIFSGNGEPVGQTVTIATGSIAISDIIALDDGTFVVGWRSGFQGVTQAFTASGAPAGSTVIINSLLDSVSSLQLAATGSSQYAVNFSSANAASVILGKGEYSTSGAVIAAPTANASNLAVGTFIVDSVEGSSVNQQFILTQSGSAFTLFNSLNGTDQLAWVLADTRDIEKVADGFYVGAGDTGLTANMWLAPWFGSGSTLSAYSTGTIVKGAVPEITGATLEVYNKNVVSLGDGRLLLSFFAETGVASSSGLYAAVYNMATGKTEGTFATPIENLMSLNMGALSLSTDVMADGRVILSWSGMKGEDINTSLTRRDVFAQVLDPRISGVTVNGTNSVVAPDNFLGTQWDDSFTRVNANDVIDGAGGNDTAVLDGAQGVRADLGLKTIGNTATLALKNIENLTGTTFDDELFGDDGANVLTGGIVGSGVLTDGNDRLMGRGGNDTLRGGTGADSLNGGSGDDTILGGAGIDAGSGGAGNDQLDGGTEDDVLSGGTGNDIVTGGDGSDRLAGNAGDDEIDGGTGNDIVTGGTGNDAIFGGVGNDIITGGDGDDVIDAGTGNDTVNGGLGADVLEGGVGIDTLTYAGLNIAGGVFADLEGSGDPMGNIGFPKDPNDEQITGFENLIGTSGDDRLYGNNLSNTLRGGNGDDILYGRASQDMLFGNQGADRFLFDSAGGNLDRVMDFTVGTDKILLLSSGFNINAGSVGASFVSNATGAAAANALPQLVFDNDGTGGGRLFFDPDGNGAAAAVLFATITFTSAAGLATFSAADFEFI